MEKRIFLAYLMQVFGYYIEENNSFALWNIFKDSITGITGLVLLIFLLVELIKMIRFFKEISNEIKDRAKVREKETKKHK